MSVIKGWKFPIQIDKTTGKIMTIEDNENIKQDIRVILETQKYQRKIVPDFGTDLMSFMFEVANSNFINDVKTRVESSLKKWEEHIDSLNVAVSTTNGALCKAEVGIDYITDISPTQDRFVKSIDTASP